MPLTFAVRSVSFEIFTHALRNRIGFLIFDQDKSLWVHEKDGKRREPLIEDHRIEKFLCITNVLEAEILNDISIPSLETAVRSALEIFEKNSNLNELSFKVRKEKETEWIDVVLRKGINNNTA